ncbi:hypothetical protein EI94DRAFT_1732133 [Lactarius quietus]|nr:hypothetical protein EI94DRAFT_1732133 [Lactarius quietus]
MDHYCLNCKVWHALTTMLYFDILDTSRTRTLFSAAKFETCSTQSRRPFECSVIAHCIDMFAILKGAPNYRASAITALMQ